MALDANNIPPLPHSDNCCIRTESGWVYADHYGCWLILILRPFHGVVYQIGRYELIVALRWKLTVHLDVRLWRISAILVDNLLVCLLVRSFYCTGIHHLGNPELPFAVKRFVEVPRVAARVAERHPESVGRVLCKEARRHRPDWVVNTRRLVEHNQHTVEVVHTRVGVGILGWPQSAFDTPVACALLKITLDQFREPLGRHHSRGRYLKPMAVDGSC